MIKATMTKRILLLTLLTLAGAAVAKRRLDRWSDAPPVLSSVPEPPRVVAETLEPAQESPDASPEPATPATEQPAAHTLRPSPVPRERPMWTPPAEGGSTGRHAAREPNEQDDAG